MNEAFQCIGFEKFDRCIPYGEEGVSHCANLFIFTFIAGLVKFVGCTGQRRYGSIKKPHDFRQVYVGRFTPKDVSTAFSLFTTQNAGFFQIEKDTFQKLAGYAARLGNIPDQEFFFGSLSHVNQGVDGVFTFLRKHGES